MSEDESPDGTTPEGPEDGGPEDTGSEHDDAGVDLARYIARGLAGAPGVRRASVRQKGGPAPQGTWRRSAPPRRGAGPQLSGARPDARDPQGVGAGLERLVGEQGWATDLRVHGVFVQWARIVGREVAAHTTPEAYAEGRLTVRTDSTAWATQLTLLAGQLVKRINDELGDETVRVIDVLGPRSPSWVKGRLRVKGRGPRDTYG